MTAAATTETRQLTLDAHKVCDDPRCAGPTDDLPCWACYREGVVAHARRDDVADRDQERADALGGDIPDRVADQMADQAAEAR